MVMSRNAMRKNLTQSIRRSLGRYIAIVAIIALGAAIFVGLLMTKTDMIATGQRHMDENNMFDLRLLNSYGWEPEQVEAMKNLPGLESVEGVMYTDVIVNLGDSPDELVYRFYAMPEQVNLFSLRGGRMPEGPDECLVDGYHIDESILGQTITVTATNSEDTLDALKQKSYTVVGYVASPLYMDMNRGTTSVGSGSLSNYIIVPRESLALDYYAEVNVTLPGQYKVYSGDYNAAMEAAAERLEPLLQPLADQRLVKVKQEAWDAYNEGKQEYDEGLAEFTGEKEKAEQELEDAYQKLLDAEQEIADNEKKLADGQRQLDAAWGQYYAGVRELAQGKNQLESMKSMLLDPIIAMEAPLRKNYEEATASVAALEAEIAAIDEEIAAIRGEMGPDADRIQELERQISNTRVQISSLNGRIQAAQGLLELLKLAPERNAEAIAELEASIAAMQAEVLELEARLPQLEGELAALQEKNREPEVRIAELEEQKEVLQSEINMLNRSIASLQSSLDSLTASREGIEAMIADSKSQILEGEKQLQEGYNQLIYQQQVLEDGLAALEEGKEELAQGWLDYEEGRAEFEKEIAEAEQELADAKEQLDEALETILAMRKNEAMVLDRTSNIGYNSLESASDIVQGVSRVIPVFFLLVASLVCITTMTRMIDEERTQIGTLKALGYSNGRIISKYLIYAGSGAVLGCGLGVLVGSAAFPVILWQAYKIMLYISDDIVLKVSWLLCGAVVGMYTVAMLSVTWYCCRKALREVPAELIRPKAPDTGKKILMEYLPFWGRISFLNKVTIRNIFRYRQRLAMMLVGIGGCTALLVTGFGLRDSIVNVVDYQFQEVTTYDMSVYFSEGQNAAQQADFLKDVADGAENAMFYHQSSMDLEFDGSTREIYMIAAGEGITGFIDLHKGDEPIPMPGLHEVVISVGAAENMGMEVGDVIRMRNADLQTLELTVSGIYDNHVENYAIVSPETITEQWGSPAAEQMAFVKVREGQDIDALCAEITGMSGVMNVSVSADLADMVGNMMEALDNVVWVIVFCAGALAVIVLYNLTNININERIREIATIKVLGFNARETAMYVFKENLALTAIGSVLGLGLGYLMLLFVMSQIRIDMVYFKALVMPQSYVISLIMTIFSAVVVCFIFYFKLDKINMAEALKSVE